MTEGLAAWIAYAASVMKAHSAVPETAPATADQSNNQLVNVSDSSGQQS